MCNRSSNDTLFLQRRRDNHHLFLRYAILRLVFTRRIPSRHELSQNQTSSSIYLQLRDPARKNTLLSSYLPPYLNTSNNHSPPSKLRDCCTRDIGYRRTLEAKELEKLPFRYVNPPVPASKE